LFAVVGVLQVWRATCGDSGLCGRELVGDSAGREPIDSVHGEKQTSDHSTLTVSATAGFPRGDSGGLERTVSGLRLYLNVPRLTSIPDFLRWGPDGGFVLHSLFKRLRT
jgi:hypothetical protein